MSQTRDPQTELGRLVWIDELRLVAILLMILDHALLMFVPVGAWPGLIRLTVTRCAEPLFVFVLAYLMIVLKRSMKVGRWFQVVAVSIVTSALLSHHLGYALGDVLVSIAVIAPFVPSLLGVERQRCLVMLHLAAVGAAVPVSVFGISFDYSPFLLAHQALLTRMYHERGGRVAVRHGAISFCLLVGATACLSKVTEPSSSAIVVMFGHPLAALIVWMIQRRKTPQNLALLRLAKCPLLIYSGHLLVFSLLNFWAA